jgi:hypothetical protein
MRVTQAAPLVGGLDLTDSRGLSQLFRYVLPDHNPGGLPGAASTTGLAPTDLACS